MTAFLMVGMLAMLAFSLDLGVICVAREELQRSADASALAATWELINFSADPTMSPVVTRETTARAKARAFAQANPVLSSAPLLSDADIELGYMANPLDPNETLVTGSGLEPNAARITVRRASNQNGSIPSFFSRVLGQNGFDAQATATAAVLYNFSGFKESSDGSNLMMLPFALDEDTWEDMLDGIGTDDWTWDSANSEIDCGGDGILEVNLYPQGTGSPGNRGTVDIGSNNNSTNDIARQILYGISAADLAYHGGSLEFDEYGELSLNADTGISAGVKDELASIKGQPRIIPIFSSVCGNGNNAHYTIVKFVGVRIMDVKLTGKMSGKHVTVQPASIVTRGGIPSSTPYQSTFVYSPVWLVR